MTQNDSVDVEELQEALEWTNEEGEESEEVEPEEVEEIPIDVSGNVLRWKLETDDGRMAVGLAVPGEKRTYNLTGGEVEVWVDELSEEDGEEDEE